MKKIALVLSIGVAPLIAMQLHDSTVEVVKLERTLSNGKLVRLPDDIFKLTKHEVVGLSCTLEAELSGDIHQAFSTAYGEHAAKIFYVALLKSRVQDLRISERWQAPDTDDHTPQ